MKITPPKVIAFLTILTFFTATHVQYQNHISEIKDKRNKEFKELKEQYKQQVVEKVKEIHSLKEKVEKLNNSIENTREKAYSEGYVAAKERYSEPYNTELTVNNKVSFQDEYLFKTVDDVKGDYKGIAYRGNNTIRIETGVEAGRFDMLCNHEVLHLKFKEYEHTKFNTREDDSIYELDEHLDTDVCDKFTEKALTS